MAKKKVERKRARSSGNVRMRRSLASLPSDYPQVLEEIKARIRASQVKAFLSVNWELIALYWDIGKMIVRRQKAEGWGRSVVERLAADIQKEFPNVRGFSPQNLWHMRSLFLAWTSEAADLQQVVGEIDGENLPQAVGEIPWGHNLQLLSKLDDPVKRLWYARQTSEHGWSRAVLVHQIESDAFARQARAITNFKRVLPAPQSDLAQQMTKDPYNFDFLTLGPAVTERQLENSLIDHLRQFLLELGKGFAFVGQQYHLEVDGNDYYLDLLFYHLHLGCYVVIELKVEEFKPEFAGKMSFYLTAVDELLPNRAGHPAIGLILCKDRSKTIVEYTLRDASKPMGVATYTTVPPKYRGELPTKKQLVGLLKLPAKKETADR